MRIRALVVVLLLPSLLIVSQSSPAAADCTENADLTVASQSCPYSAAEIEAEKAKFPTAVWTIEALCEEATLNSQGECFQPECTTDTGATGVTYRLFMDGKEVGIACLTKGEAGEVDDPPPIRALVLKAFENLDWRPSELVVQPPGGKTLVNLDTNFYTSNADARSIPVNLVESRVVVTAQPIAYRWNFGDGTSTTTTSAGAPYPDLDVAHVYQSTEKVVVSVDTQYGAASFTVDGGPPEQIPSTIWVAGEGQDLQVVEALPQLVIR